MKHVAVKSLLSVMLSLMMVVVFTPAIAFADEPETVDSNQKVSVEVEEQDVDEPPIAPSDQEEYFKQIEDQYDAESIGAAQEPVKGPYNHGQGAVNYVSSPSKIWSGTKNYMDRSSEGKSYYVVNLNAGVVGIYANQNNYVSNSSALGYLNIYKDKALTQKLSEDDMYVYEDLKHTYSGAEYFNVPTTGTYYVDVEFKSWSFSDTSKIRVTLLINNYAAATNGGTIKPNTVYGACAAADTTSSYYCTASKSGYFKIVTDDYTTSSLRTSGGTLLGSQKSDLYDPVFGVKKYSKYKVSVKTPTYLSADGYLVYVKNVAWANKSGKSKSKAATLKKGKYKKGVIVAGSTKAQWFKIKKSKNNKTFKVILKGATNNELKVTIYKGGKKYYGPNTVYYNNSGIKLTMFYAPKGTYYVKVAPGKKSSGYYKVKWKY